MIRTFFLILVFTLKLRSGILPESRARVDVVGLLVLPVFKSGEDTVVALDNVVV